MPVLPLLSAGVEHSTSCFLFVSQYLNTNREQTKPHFMLLLFEDGWTNVDQSCRLIMIQIITWCKENVGWKSGWRVKFEGFSWLKTKGQGNIRYQLWVSHMTSSCFHADQFSPWPWGDRRGSCWWSALLMHQSSVRRINCRCSILTSKVESSKVNNTVRNPCHVLDQEWEWCYWGLVS